MVFKTLVHPPFNNMDNLNAVYMQNGVYVQMIKCLCLVIYALYSYIITTTLCTSIAVTVSNLHVTDVCLCRLQNNCLTVIFLCSLCIFLSFCQFVTRSASLYL